MRGSTSCELDVVGASADEIWAVFGDNNLSKQLFTLLPGVFDKIDFVEGDGGVGTVLHLVLSEGSPKEWKEKFVKVDHHKRVKVIDQVEGGYLSIGFTHHRNTYEIIEKDCNSCIIKSSINFTLDDKLEEKSNLITVDGAGWGMSQSVVAYVLNKKKAQSGDAHGHKGHVIKT